MKIKKRFFLNYIKVDYNYEGQRIDNFLLKKIKSLSKNKIYSLIRKGNIRVNKKRILPKYRLIVNDLIRIPLVKFNEVPKIRFLKKDIILKFKNIIVYEDKCLLVINKPTGISVHGGTNIFFNIINIFKFLNPKLRYLELVHRLDKNTSGLLIIAKKRSILRILHKYFRENKIKKIYIALVHGHWPVTLRKVNKDIIINKFNKNNFKKEIKKSSVSFFKVKKYIGNYTLLFIKPLTGRKHQIRIHTSLSGYPIVFDNIYGNYKLDVDLYHKFKFKRLFLHSYSVSFFHPYYNKYIFINVDLDNDLLLFLKKLENI